MMTVDAPQTFPGFNRERVRGWVWCGVLAVIIFTGAIRLRMVDIPLERDEGEYAYTGQLMLQGVPPYKEAYFMKLPGTHAMYALSMAVFGQTRAGIHWGLLVVNVIGILLTFFIGRKLSDPMGGLIACAAFGIMSLSSCVLGPIAHATQFVVVFALAGILLLCRALESGRGAAYFLSGVAFGIALLMKQPGAFFAVFGAVIIAWATWRNGPFSWRVLARRGTWYSIGVALPYAVTCFILWRAGVFDRFWFWTVTYVRAYGTTNSFSAGMWYLKTNLQTTADTSMFLWLLGIAGAVCVWRDREAGAARTFVPTLVLFSLAAVAQGSFFRPHYFVMLLPSLALALGVGVRSFGRLILKAKTPGVPATMPVRLAALGLFLAIVGQWNYLFVASPSEICRRLYYSGAVFVVASDVANYIKTNTSEADRVAVIGSEPEILFYSRRRSATGYIYAYSLMEKNEFAKRMQQEMIREVEAARPEFVVFMKTGDSWGKHVSAKEPVLEWVTTYCNDFYELAGMVDFVPWKLSTFYLGKDAERQPSRNEAILIFKRKAAENGKSEPH